MSNFMSWGEYMTNTSSQNSHGAVGPYSTYSPGHWVITHGAATFQDREDFT